MCRPWLDNTCWNIMRACGMDREQGMTTAGTARGLDSLFEPQNTCRAAIFCPHTELLARWFGALVALETLAGGWAARALLECSLD